MYNTVYLQLQEKLYLKHNNNTDLNAVIYPPFVQAGVSYAQRTQQSLNSTNTSPADTAIITNTQQ